MPKSYPLEGRRTRGEALGGWKDCHDAAPEAEPGALESRARCNQEDVGLTWLGECPGDRRRVFGIADLDRLVVVCEGPSVGLEAKGQETGGALADRSISYCPDRADPAGGDMSSEADVIDSKSGEFDLCDRPNESKRRCEVQTAGGGQLDAAAREPNEPLVPQPLELEPDCHFGQACTEGQSTSTEECLTDVIRKLDRYDRFLHSSLLLRESAFRGSPDHTPEHPEAGPDP